MEELYILLSDRALFVEEIKTRMNLLKTLTGSSDSNDSKSLLNKSKEVLEFNKYLHWIKKNEKKRVIKENEVIDIIFNIKAFDLTQRQRFHDKSYETLRQLTQDFVYKKQKGLCDSKEIASLFLNYFFFVGMRNKVEDLKRIYVDNKIRGFPIISVLAKWLVEMTRDQLKSMIKIASEEYESKTASQQNQEKTLINLTSPKTRKIFSSSKVLRTCGDETTNHINNKPLNEEQIQPKNKKKEFKIQSYFSGDAPKGEKPKEVLKENDVNIEARPHSRNHSQNHPHKSNSSNALINAQSGQNPRESSQNNKKKNNIIQVYIRISGVPKSFLDPIEDLDFSLVPAMYQWIGLHKHGNKIGKPTNLISVDIDKKKEALAQIYKNLYSRNSETEKTMNNFYSKNLRNGRIKSRSNYIHKKGETFIEDYTQEYVENLYKNVQRQSHHIHNFSKGRRGQKKWKTPISLINQFHSPYDVQRPSSSIPLRGARQIGTSQGIRTLSNNPGEIQQPSASQNNTYRKYEGGNTTKEELEKLTQNENGQSNLTHDHYFRILKAANIFRKPTRSKNEKKDVLKNKEKFEQTNISSGISNFLERLYLSSNKVVLSEESFSTQDAKGVSLADHYLKKADSIEEGINGDKVSGISLIHKSQAKSNLIMYTEFQKRFSLLDRKNSKENKLLYTPLIEKAEKIHQGYEPKHQVKERGFSPEQNKSNLFALERKKSVEIDNKKRLLKQYSDNTIKKDVFFFCDSDNLGELSLRKKKDLQPESKKEGGSLFESRIINFQKNMNKTVSKQ